MYIQAAVQCYVELWHLLDFFIILLFYYLTYKQCYVIVIYGL